jgi:hypothetical protein
VYVTWHWHWQGRQTLDLGFLVMFVPGALYAWWCARRGRWQAFLGAIAAPVSLVVAITPAIVTL